MYMYGLPQLVLVVKNLPANSKGVRDTGLSPPSGRSPGGGHRNPLEYSCLENPVDRGAWRATVHKVAKSQTQLKWLSTHACIYTHIHIHNTYVGDQKHNYISLKNFEHLLRILWLLLLLLIFVFKKKIPKFKFKKAIENNIGIPCDSLSKRDFFKQHISIGVLKMICNLKLHLKTKVCC